MIQHVAQGCQFSDLLAVNLKLKIHRPGYIKIKISLQKINISNKLMANEIKSKLDGIRYYSLSEHVHLYTDTLGQILEKYAPIKVQCKTCKPNELRYKKNKAASLCKRCKLVRQYFCNPENINLKEQYTVQKFFSRSLVKLNMVITQSNAQK